MGFPARGALQGGWELGGAECSPRVAPSLGTRRGRGEVPGRSLPRFRPTGPRLTAPRPPPPGQAGNWRLVRANWGKAGEKLRCGNPTRGVGQGGARGGQERGGRDPTTQPPRPPRHPAVLCFPPLSLPLPSPLPRSPGGGARGAASGAARVSGAALAHAPGPGAVQVPRPQLCLLRARPCTSLLNWLGGVVGRRLLPLQTPPLTGPPFRATFGFFFCAPRRPGRLDLFHESGSPTRGSPPP